MSAPTTRWASAVWGLETGSSIVSKTILRQCFREAKLAVELGKGACRNQEWGEWHEAARIAPVWRNVMGPASGLIATLARIGWKAVDWNKWEDSEGKEWRLDQVCPVTIKKVIEADTEWWLHGKVARTMNQPQLRKGIALDPILKKHTEGQYRGMGRKKRGSPAVHGGGDAMDTGAAA